MPFCTISGQPPPSPTPVSPLSVAILTKIQLRPRGRSLRRPSSALTRNVLTESIFTCALLTGDRLALDRPGCQAARDPPTRDQEEDQRWHDHHHAGGHARAPLDRVAGPALQEERQPDRHG